MRQSCPTRKSDLCEKLLLGGAQSLSDTELVALFIQPENNQHARLQLAAQLIAYVGDLRTLLNADLKTISHLRSLELLRFVQLQAAREMCRRSDLIGLQREPALKSSHDAYTFLKRALRDKKNETFSALFLDSQHRVVSYEELFKGTIDASSVHSRPIIERVLQLNAAALIVAHNHPSGVAEASQQDIAFTHRLRQALELIDTELLDHLVIGDNLVYSIMSDVHWRCY